MNLLSFGIPGDETPDGSIVDHLKIEVSQDSVYIWQEDTAGSMGIKPNEKFDATIQLTHQQLEKLIIVLTLIKDDRKAKK